MLDGVFCENDVQLLRRESQVQVVGVGWEPQAF